MDARLASDSYVNAHPPGAEIPHHEAGEHQEHEQSQKRSDHGGHTDHTGHEQLFRNRFWSSLLLTLPVLLYNPMIQAWFNFTMPVFPGSRWISPALSTVIFVIGGLPFLQMAAPELRKRQPGMMTLISMAISIAFVYSMAGLIVGAGTDFFWELVTLIDIMLLGHWIELRSVRQASGALQELAGLMPDMAERDHDDGRVEIVAASSLQVGDRVLVRPGASIPADGLVIAGKSAVNEAMLTGESAPVQKEPGAEVIAGTINGGGSLRVRVTATGEQTALAGIMRWCRKRNRANRKRNYWRIKRPGGSSSSPWASPP